MPAIAASRVTVSPRAPKGSRHQRMLWAARKTARLTRVTEGGAYQTLESAVIEAERPPRLNPRDFNDRG